MLTTAFDVFYIHQLESEKVIKNTTEWTLNQYYANYSSFFNTTDVPLPNVHPADVIRGPCWETAVGIVSKVPVQNSGSTISDFLVMFYLLSCCSGVCEADSFRHSGDVLDHPGRGLCPGRDCPLS